MAKARGARRRALVVIVGLSLLLVGGGIALAGGGKVAPMISGACGPTPPATTCVTRWTCDASGEWVPTYRAAGYVCNDNVACTYNDRCDGAGTCVGTTISCASDQCNTRACNGTSTCAVTPKANGTTCSDGNACTQGDTCQAGTCVGGAQVQCSAGQCQNPGTCNPASGQCSAPTNKADLTACSDGNLCTQGDTCQAGTCVGGAQVQCSADQCHNPGTCNPATGQCSTPTNKPDLTSCNDGNACTQTDTCQAGTCVGGSPVQCSAGQCQIAGSCVPATGQCTAPTNKPNQTPCNDGNACTQTDTCQAGTCIGGNPKTCAASNQCHVEGVCNPSTGTCSDPAKPNGTPCSSGNTCAGGEACTAGTCGGGVPVCTTGACDD